MHFTAAEESVEQVHQSVLYLGSPSHLDTMANTWERASQTCRAAVLSMPKATLGALQCNLQRDSENYNLLHMNECWEAEQPTQVCCVFHVLPCFHKAKMELCAEGVLEAPGISLCLSSGSQAVIYLTRLCDFPLNSKVNGFLTSFKCTTRLSVAATFQPSSIKRT